jgi:hypothetical protein
MLGCNAGSRIAARPVGHLLCQMFSPDVEPPSRPQREVQVKEEPASSSSCGDDTPCPSADTSGDEALSDVTAPTPGEGNTAGYSVALPLHGTLKPSAEGPRPRSLLPPLVCRHTQGATDEEACPTQSGQSQCAGTHAVDA